MVLVFQTVRHTVRISYQFCDHSSANTDGRCRACGSRTLSESLTIHHSSCSEMQDLWASLWPFHYSSCSEIYYEGVVVIRITLWLVVYALILLQYKLRLCRYLQHQNQLHLCDDFGLLSNLQVCIPHHEWKKIEKNHQSHLWSKLYALNNERLYLALTHRHEFEGDFWNLSHVCKTEVCRKAYPRESMQLQWWWLWPVTQSSVSFH